MMLILGLPGLAVNRVEGHWVGRTGMEMATCDSEFYVSSLLDDRVPRYWANHFF